MQRRVRGDRQSLRSSTRLVLRVLLLLSTLAALLVLATGLGRSLVTAFGVFAAGIAAGGLVGAQWWSVGRKLDEELRQRDRLAGRSAESWARAASGPSNPGAFS